MKKQVLSRAIFGLVTVLSMSLAMAAFADPQGDEGGRGGDRPGFGGPGGGPGWGHPPGHRPFPPGRPPGYPEPQPYPVPVPVPVPSPVANQCDCVFTSDASGSGYELVLRLDGGGADQVIGQYQYQENCEAARSTDAQCFGGAP